MQMTFLALGLAASAAVATVQLTTEHMPLLEQLANPSSYQIDSACGDNSECRAGLRRDAQQLNAALAMLNESQRLQQEHEKQLKTLDELRN